MNGRVVPWEEATVHITSETAARGVNVFEGLRAYWWEREQAHAVIALDAHLARLVKSATLLYLPVDSLTMRVDEGIAEVVRALGHRGNLYIRTVIYLEEGRYTAAADDMRLGAYVVAYPLANGSPEPVTCAVTTWRRCPDTVMPTGAKVGATYAALRLARIEAAARGADEPILLNERGTVAETAGAAVFVVRQGTVYTPPIADGILDSITRRIAIRLLTEGLGIPVVEQSLTRSSLLSADEAFLTGTLDEIRPVAAIDGVRLLGGAGPVVGALRKQYGDMCYGSQPPLQQDWVQLLESNHE
jgi:branched-chain amino acid aminotransferase